MVCQVNNSVNVYWQVNTTNEKIISIHRIVHDIRLFTIILVSF
jgi:hypothetical protein